MLKGEFREMKREIVRVHKQTVGGTPVLSRVYGESSIRVAGMAREAEERQELREIPVDLRELRVGR